MSRLLVKFTTDEYIPLNSPREYIRDFIYSCLKETKFSDMHDAKYKHFTFSNIFPYDPISKVYMPTQTYNLIFSSPYQKLIKLIETNLSERKQVKFGDNTWALSSMKFLPATRVIKKVATATPIILRIPNTLYDDFQIESNKDFEFWDGNQFLDVFYKSLLKNGVRRYQDYCASVGISCDMEESKLPVDLFRMFRFKKVVYGWDKHFRGTMWEFEINEKWQQSEFMKYLYYAGLGERNASSGSGFINIIN